MFAIRQHRHGLVYGKWGCVFHASEVVELVQYRLKGWSLLGVLPPTIPRDVPDFLHLRRNVFWNTWTDSSDHRERHLHCLFDVFERGFPCENLCNINETWRDNYVGLDQPTTS